MSKFQWILLKYPLMVMVLTFCTLKLIIVNDIEQWQEDTPRDAARYILPDQNTTIIFPSHLLVQKLLTTFNGFNKLDSLSFS